MKIFKLYGSRNGESSFSLQGLKTLYNDGYTRNDIQTTMAVIQWINTFAYILDSWLWDNNQRLTWDDGSPINLD